MAASDTVTYEAPYADADTVNKDASGFNNSYSEEWAAQTGKYALNVKQLKLLSLSCY